MAAGKIFAGNTSYESEPSSFRVAASEKVLVPGGEGEGSSFPTDQLEVAEALSEDTQVCVCVKLLTYNMSTIFFLLNKSHYYSFKIKSKSYNCELKLIILQYLRISITK